MDFHTNLRVLLEILSEPRLHLKRDDLELVALRVVIGEPAAGGVVVPRADIDVDLLPGRVLQEFGETELVPAAPERPPHVDVVGRGGPRVGPHPGVLRHRQRRGEGDDRHAAEDVQGAPGSGTPEHFVPAAQRDGEGGGARDAAHDQQQRQRPHVPRQPAHARVALLMPRLRAPQLGPDRHGRRRQPLRE